MVNACNKTEADNETVPKQVDKHEESVQKENRGESAPRFQKEDYQDFRKNVQVRGLPPTWNEAKFVEETRVYGEIVCHRWFAYQTNAVGFVQFATPKQAQQAIQSLDGKQVENEHVLQAQFAKKQRFIRSRTVKNNARRRRRRENKWVQFRQANQVNYAQPNVQHYWQPQQSFLAARVAAPPALQMSPSFSWTSFSSPPLSVPLSIPITPRMSSGLSLSWPMSVPSPVSPVASFMMSSLDPRISGNFGSPLIPTANNVVVGPDQQKQSTPTQS